MLDADYYNEYYRTMGMVIRLRRLDAFSNMEKFAEDVVKMKVQQYSKYEIGRNMKTKTLLRILTPLNMSLGEFFNEVDKHMNHWLKKNKKTNQ